MKKISVVILLLILSLTNLHPVSGHVQTNFVYSVPVPNALYVPPETTITLNSAISMNAGGALASYFTVTGTKSGTHTGKVVLSDDYNSIIFKPDVSFENGEKVSVIVKPGISTTSGAILTGFSFSFTIEKEQAKGQSYNQYLSDLLEIPANSSATSPNVKSALTTSVYKTLPADLPEINVTVPANGTGDGYLFLSNFSINPSQPAALYLLMIDNNGEPVFVQPVSGNIYATDFKKQPNGLLTYCNQSVDTFFVMDSTYTVIDSVNASNGFLTDVHELLMLPNGHILVITFELPTIDMTAYGGLPDATVVGFGIQELDSNKNVVFQWRTLDHLDELPFTDSAVDLTGNRVDYAHANAISVDTDGNLLFSMRHMSEIIKINRFNGDIMWIMGGKGNQFDFGSDEGFNYQHDVRKLANGDISLFDNNTIGPAPHYSRAVEYQVDEYYKTATMVWQFRNTPDTFSAAMGDNQRLPNGNSVIGWGTANPPTLTEVKPDGSKAFEMALGNGEVSYRAFRFPWVGHPIDPPDLVYAADGGIPTLYYSWNGATEIKSYRLYGGVTLDNMTLLTEVPKAGFETSTAVSTWVNDYCYFKIMPVDMNDAETQFSNPVFLPGAACHPIYMPTVSTSN